MREELEIHLKELGFLYITSPVRLFSTLLCLDCAFEDSLVRFREPGGAQKGRRSLSESRDKCLTNQPPSVLLCAGPRPTTRPRAPARP
jgi:hypothetical protein